MKKICAANDNNRRLRLYDTLGRLTRATLPDNDGDANNNPKYDYAYDAASNLTSVSDPLSHVTTFSYDALNRHTATTDALSHTTSYGYDAASNQTSVTNALSKTTTFAYDTASRLISETTPLNKTTTYTLNGAGEVTVITDPLNRTVTLTYTSRGWLDQVGTPGSTTTHTYDANGNLLGRTVSGSNNQVSYGYDTLNRVISETRVSNQFSYGYDAAGNLTKITTAMGFVTTIAYDARNRATSVTEPDPDGGGSLTSPVTSFGYDAASNRTTVADPLNRVTTTAYDAQNRATSVTDPRSGVTTFSYDLAGRMTSLKDPVNNLTTWVYDNADRLTQEIDPNNKTTTYSYDNADRLTEIKDRLARRRQFVYDDGDRLTTEKWVDSGGATVRTVTYTYNNASQLDVVSDPDSTYDYGYDISGRLQTIDNYGTPGVPNLVLTFGYTGEDRTSVSDSLGLTTNYTFDTGGRLTSINIGFPDEPMAYVGLTYDADSRLTAIERKDGITSGPKVATAFTYDNLARQTQIAHSYYDGVSTTTPLATYTYAYNAASEVTQYTGPEGTLNYSYYATSELNTVTGARSETYTYDLNGNRNMTGYTVTTGNRLTSDGTFNYTYDDEGNVLTQTKISNSDKFEFTWDYRNRLTKVVLKNSGGTVLKEERFTYDVWNRRIGVWVDADGAGSGSPVQAWTVYDGANPYADFNSAGSLTNRYLSSGAIDELFARLDASNNESWYLTDGLGSVRQIASTAGSILDTLTYDSYGNLLSETTPANGDRFGFAGMEDSSIGGPSFQGARHYFPGNGNWASEDPISFEAGDANLRRYVGNGPTNATDPTGLDPDANSIFWAGVGYTTDMGGGGEPGDIVGVGWWAVPKRVSAGGAIGPAWNPGWLTKKVLIPLHPVYDPVLKHTQSFAVGYVEGAVGIVTSPYDLAKLGYGLYTGQLTWSPKNIPTNLGEMWEGIKADPARAIGRALPGLKIPTIPPIFCFPAGTPVATEHGLKPIETIQTGENVWAYNFKSSRWELHPVVEPLQHDYTGDLVTITVNGEEIEATGNHPFWVIEGDKLDSRPEPEHVPSVQPDNAATPGRWVDGRDLRVGDVLLLRASKPGRTEGVSIRTDALRVHNLHVAKLHTFAVGTGQALVHNRSFPILPKFKKGGPASGTLRAGGKDIPLSSGATGYAQHMPKGTRGFNGHVRKHIEGHAGAYMRMYNIMRATLKINRPRPCRGTTGCHAMLPRMLPPGARLTVIGSGGLRIIYVGLP